MVRLAGARRILPRRMGRRGDAARRSRPPAAAIDAGHRRRDRRRMGRRVSAKRCAVDGDHAVAAATLPKPPRLSFSPSRRSELPAWNDDASGCAATPVGACSADFTDHGTPRASCARRCSTRAIPPAPTFVTPPEQWRRHDHDELLGIEPRTPRKRSCSTSAGRAADGREGDGRQDGDCCWQSLAVVASRWASTASSAGHVAACTARCCMCRCLVKAPGEAPAPPTVGEPCPPERPGRHAGAWFDVPPHRRGGRDADWDDDDADYGTQRVIVAAGPTASARCGRATGSCGSRPGGKTRTAAPRRAGALRQAGRSMGGQRGGRSLPGRRGATC